MNRGIKRGLGMGSFWPDSSVLAYNLSPGTVPQFDVNQEGSIGFGSRPYTFPYYGNAPTVQAGTLNVAGAVSTENAFFGLNFIGTQNANGQCTVDLRSYGGTYTAPTASPSGTDLGGMHIGSCTGGTTSPTLQDCAQFFCHTTETHSTSASGCRWDFYTTPNTTNNKQVAFTIDQDQSLNIIASSMTNTASRTDIQTISTQTFATTGSMTHTWLSYTGTDTWSVAPLGFGTTFKGLAIGPTIRNDPAQTLNLGGFNGINVTATMTVDTATGRDNGASISYTSSPTFNVANAGTFTAGTYIGLNSTPTVNGTSCTMTSLTTVKSAAVVTAGTATTITGISLLDTTGAGAVTNQYGIDIAAMTKAGTTNVGIRCTPAIVLPPTTCTVTSNAGTVPVSCANAKLTNSSAATITVTMAVTNAQDGQITDVRIYDATAATQTITWVNTENGKTSVPSPTLGSTTIATHARFMYNSVSSKWTCIGL